MGTVGEFQMLAIFMGKSSICAPHTIVQETILFSSLVFLNQKQKQQN